MEGGPVSPIEQHEEFGRLVRRIAQPPSVAGDAHSDGLRGIEGQADGRQLDVSAGDGAGLVVPKDRARLSAAPPVRKRYRVNGHLRIVTEQDA